MTSVETTPAASHGPTMSGAGKATLDVALRLGGLFAAIVVVALIFIAINPNIANLNMGGSVLRSMSSVAIMALSKTSSSGYRDVCCFDVAPANHVILVTAVLLCMVNPLITLRKGLTMIGISVGNLEQRGRAPVGAPLPARPPTSSIPLSTRSRRVRHQRGHLRNPPRQVTGLGDADVDENDLS